MDTEESFALRAFIQRGETRLGTMHGVAGAFISGAGLLILVPLFFRGAVAPLFNLMSYEISSPKFMNEHAILMLWSVPILCSLSLPVYSLYLLIEQLVVLYFIPQVARESYFLPRFALTPLSMPLDDPRVSSTGSDESDIKRLVVAHTYEHDIWIAVSEDQNTADRKNLGFVGLRFPELISPLGPRRNARTKFGHDGQDNIAWAYDVRAGKTGLRDRTLIAEAARIETLLVRLNARLRVMAIRYFKSLLMLIWTLILFSVLVALLNYLSENPPDTPQFAHMRELIVLAIGLLWSSITPYLINLPLLWISKIGDKNTLFARHGDVDLSHFEAVVFICSLLSFFASAAGLFIGIPELELEGTTRDFTWVVLALAIILSLINLTKAGLRLRR